MSRKFIVFAILILVFSSFNVIGQGFTEAEQVGVAEPTVCCEKTNAGLFCQDVREEDCASDRQPPTACESTSFCKPGFCFDSVEGTCLDNTPQLVCNENGGTWSETKPAQCELGCCLLNDQASFVTLTRCKRLSSFFALETNFNTGLTNEVQCILTAGSQEKGACVFNKDFEITCRSTTRAGCTPGSVGVTDSDIGPDIIGGQTGGTTGGLSDDLVPTPDSGSGDNGGSGGAGDDGGGAGGTTPQQHNINIANIAFSDQTITIQEGDTITWTNQDSTQHTVTSVSGGELDSGTMNQGATYSHTFNSAGTFDYLCEFHPGIAAMEATVIVEAVQQAPPPGEVEFHPGKLCSAEELGTNCGPSKETTCLPGKEEVYFVDTCGNPANIYDGSKINNKAYWANDVRKQDSCGPNSNNANSQSCGNCNYILGSTCRPADSGSANPTYGDNICVNLNCIDENGATRLHGESWCAFDEGRDFSPILNPDTAGDQLDNAVARFSDQVGNEFRAQAGTLVNDALGKLGAGQNIGTPFLSSSGAPVGSRFYRRMCNNGEILVEPCADFRQEECIENTVRTNQGDFTEAACRVNRWQDCTAQTGRQDCENADQRDCRWFAGIEYVLMGGLTNGSTLAGGNALQQLGREIKSGERELGSCVPENSPGLNFWRGEEAAGICAQANAICPVTYEKGIGGDWKCVENCECLPGGELELKRAQLCMAIADCGPKTNFIGQKGRGTGYRIFEQESDD